MKTLTLKGKPPIDMVFRRSAQARRITLRISQLDGRVTLTAPRQVTQRDALAFARTKEEWIRARLSSYEPPRALSFGDRIPVLGEMRPILPGLKRGVSLSDAGVHVSADPEQVGRKLQAWLKQLARSELVYASDRYASAAGCSYSKITLRDTRSRWGSCSSHGALMYSWRLIMAPPEVLSYVAAHEVAHLKELNHSPAFWHVVKQIYGDYHAQTAWLRKNGASLHKYRFAD
jgi:predicted metal-dependent hydrolase